MMEPSIEFVPVEVKEEQIDNQVSSSHLPSSSGVDKVTDADRNSHLMMNPSEDPLKVEVKEELCDDQTYATLPLASSHQSSGMGHLRNHSEDALSQCGRADIKEEDIWIKDEPVEDLDLIAGSTTTFTPKPRSTGNKDCHQYKTRSQTTGGSTAPPSTQPVTTTLLPLEPFTNNKNSSAQTEKAAGHGGLSLQRKWKHLQDNFARELKRQKTLPSGSQARKGTYIYFRRLQFLEGSISSKETISNIENEGEGLCDDVDVTGEHREKGITSTSAKKKLKLNQGDLHIANILERSLLARQIEEEKQNDEDKLFCLSLYKEMKKVPESSRLMTKIELLNVLHRAQTLGTHHPIQSFQYANSYTQPLPHYSGFTGQPQTPYTRVCPTPSPVATNSVHNIQPVHQAHSHNPPTAGPSGYNPHTPSSPSVVHPMTPSPGGAASQVSDTQSDYIDMFD